MVRQVFTEQNIMNDTSTNSAFIFNRFHILRDQSLINIIISRKQLNNISDTSQSGYAGRMRLRPCLYDPCQVRRISLQ